MLLAVCVTGISQTITGDRLVARQSIYLRNAWIDSLKQDTSFQGFNKSIPTADAVFRFVQGRLLWKQDYADTSTWDATRHWVQQQGYITSANNFANADLTLTDNRSHDGNSFGVYFNNFTDFSINSANSFSATVGGTSGITLSSGSSPEVLLYGNATNYLELDNTLKSLRIRNGYSGFPGNEPTNIQFYDNDYSQFGKLNYLNNAFSFLDNSGTYMLTIGSGAVTLADGTGSTSITRPTTANLNSLSFPDSSGKLLLGVKLNGSIPVPNINGIVDLGSAITPGDTASMLSNYTRRQELKDTAAAIRSAIGGTVTLQSATDNGNTTTNDVYFNGDVFVSGTKFLDARSIRLYDDGLSYRTTLRVDGNNSANEIINFQTGSGTVAFLSDIPGVPVISDSAWSLTGNNITYGKYIGTNNDFDLNFYTNGIKRVSIDSASGEVDAIVSLRTPLLKVYGNSGEGVIGQNVKTTFFGDVNSSIGGSRRFFSFIDYSNGGSSVWVGNGSNSSTVTDATIIQQSSTTGQSQISSYSSSGVFNTFNFTNGLVGINKEASLPYTFDIANTNNTGNDASLAIRGRVSDNNWHGQIYLTNSVGTNYSSLYASVNGLYFANEVSSNRLFIGRHNAAGGMVVNDIGDDYDVRIEGDTDPNLLFTDASADEVRIGTASDLGTSKLQVLGGIVGTEGFITGDNGTGNRMIFEATPNGGLRASRSYYATNGLAAFRHTNQFAAVANVDSAMFTIDMNGKAGNVPLLSSGWITQANALQIKATTSKDTVTTYNTGSFYSTGLDIYSEQQFKTTTGAASSAYGVKANVLNHDNGSSTSSGAFAFYADAASAVTGKAYAFYANSGKSYFSDEVNIGTTTDAGAYKLQMKGGYYNNMRDGERFVLDSVQGFYGSSFEVKNFVDVNYSNSFTTSVYGAEVIQNNAGAFYDARFLTRRYRPDYFSGLISQSYEDPATYPSFMYGTFPAWNGGGNYGGIYAYNGSIQRVLTIHPGTFNVIINSQTQTDAGQKFQVNGSTLLDGAVTINESGADADFRVEGDTDPNLFFTDASADIVLIGTSSPLTNGGTGSSKLNIQGNNPLVINNTTVVSGYEPIIAAYASPYYGSTQVFSVNTQYASHRSAFSAPIIEQTTDHTGYIKIGNTAAAIIQNVGDSQPLAHSYGSRYKTKIRVFDEFDITAGYTGADTTVFGVRGAGNYSSGGYKGFMNGSFLVGGNGTVTASATLDVRGSAIFNENGADYDVRIEGDTDPNLLFTDASTDRIGIGTDAPGSSTAGSYKLDVNGVANFREGIDVALQEKLRFKYNDIWNDGMELYISNTPQAFISTPGIPALNFVVNGGSIMSLNSGNVRILTSSVAHTLEVNGTIGHSGAWGLYSLAATSTAAAPTYSFYGNSNTGIYSGGLNSNTINFSTGGTFAATIKSNKVGIGTGTPDSTLHVVGGFKLVNGTEGAGKVLTSDANGGASWQDPTGGVSDGDKGDITVSASGATWTIDNAAVQIDDIDATGTPSGSTFLRGDGTWAAPAGAGTVTNTGNLTANSLVIGNGTTDVKISSITTDGTSTITAGVWNGTAIGDAYIASAATWNGKQAAYANLTTIGSLANAAGWLYNNGSGTFSYSTPTKSDVGLGNVENTALSTWAGSSNIITVGTIATGTWSGSTITVNKGGTGATTLTGIVIGDGTNAMTAVAGTGGQLLRRNAGNTAYEFFTPTYLTAEVDGSTTNELQTLANTSDATSHTVTLSNSGGSIQLVEGTGITLTTSGTAGDGIVTIASTATGVSDGDKGDITVSASGATWTIDNDVVTYAKMQNISAAGKILGRWNTGAGDAEEITLGNTFIEIVDGTLDVADNSSTQKVQVAKNSGAVTGTRKKLNFIEGSNVTLTIADDAGNDEVDITIASTASGGVADPGGNGVMVRTALNTTTARTLTGTADRITITNGDGTAGNPTFDIASTYAGQNTITTLGTITTGTWNGAAIGDAYISSAATWNAKQAAYTNLTSIGSLANAAGWLYNNGSGTFSYSTPTKTDVGLGNVENTALSTWAGSANITTLGTIGTGTWQGGVISSTYGGTGVNNGGRTLTINTNSGTIAFGAASKTLTVNNSITLTGTDATTMTFPTTSATIARTDAAQTFTGVQTFSSAPVLSTGTVTVSGSTITFPTTASTLATTATTQTFTNKRVTQRVNTTASSSSLTIDSDASDMYTITALAAACTMNNPSGTPTDGQKLTIRIKDNGTARGLTWSGTQWRASTDIPLPTTTILGKTMYLGFVWNAADSKWDLIAYVDNF